MMTDETAIRLRPLNPYGESTRRIDVWTLDETRGRSAPDRVNGAKFFDVYGFGEWHKGPMASVVRRAFDGRQATGVRRLFERPRADVAGRRQMRDFIFVDDVAAVRVAHPRSRGIVNLDRGAARG